jgi:hypothetical protein
MLKALFRAFLLRRLFESANRRGRSSYGYGRRYGRRRARGGFGWTGPFPSYSRRTRRGSRVTVTGCCLPIPLALTIAPPAVYALWRRR